MRNGYNVGLLLEPANATRLGLCYRSHVEHEVGGEADIIVPAPAGASYQHSETLSRDVGYAHLFIGDAAVGNTEVNTGHALTGEFEGDVDILTAQVDILTAQLVWRMR